MRRLTIFLAALLLTSCANNATVTYAWKAEDIQTRKDLSGVLVLAVTTHADIRARFEQEFTDALSARDLHAVASYTLNPASKIDKAAVIAMAKEANTDTVLVTTYAGRDEYEVLHPGRTYYRVAPVYYNDGYYRRGGVYGVPYEVAHVPDFYAQHKSLHLEANLYVVSDGEHLWQAAVGIEETQEIEKLIPGFIAALVDQLKADQLVR